MTRTIKALCILVGLFCAMNSFIPQNKGGKALARETEIKGVWAATVFSLDFPGQTTTDSNRLMADIDKMVNSVYNMGYNTLFFQVRPAADAFYKSDLFPWSQYLTGTQGTAPQNSFDPLQYAVETAHKKGIELHAWINPYRVTATAADKEKLAENSIARKYPELTAEYTDGKLYLNPGEPEAQKLVVDGAVEIVKNYEVDGIHIDDYFYPGSDFPDSETFTKYGGRFADIGDWRRDNVTSLIRKLKAALKSENENIIFSVSPCGIWANKESNPNGSDTGGKQAYYDYYADTRLWVQEELVDWIIPQIYWNIGYDIADFQKLADWWNDTAEGTKVKVCIGQAAYRAADETNTGSVWYAQSGIEELERQTALMRNLKNVSGYVHYRLQSLEKSDALMTFAVTINNQEKNIFNDVGAYLWAKEAIEALYEKGIVKGMGDGSFGCARTVTRADFMVMLTRMMNKSAVFAENFDDVTEDKYYYKEIGIAKALGYTEGRGDNIFDPVGNISRQDMAVMAYRVLVSENKINTADASTLEKRFSDAQEISGYAREAVAAMVENGYLNGYETGEFIPRGNATRAETAVFLNKLFKIID